jgi:phytoene synthase
MQRQRLLAVYAWQRELRDLVEMTELSVAQTKLEWWRQETQRLMAGAARHPVTQAIAVWLAQDSAVKPLVQAAMTDGLDAVEHDLQHAVYSEFSQLREYCRCTYSPAVVLLLSAVTDKQGQSGANFMANFAADYGIAWGLFERLQAVHQDALRGRLYLPEDELIQQGLRFEDLQRRQATPALRQYFAQQAERVRAGFNQAEQQIPLQERYRQRHLMVLMRLLLAQLDAIENDAYRLLEQQLILPPLRLFWIAFSTLRRERSHPQK